MKKNLLFLLALLPLALGFAACSDDNDLPNVDITTNFGDAKIVNGVVYVVQGETLTIEGLTITNKEEGKGAGISSANYYWDYVFVGTNPLPPYGFKFETTEDTPVGRHVLEIICPVFAVDKTLADALLAYNVQVVASPDDIPEGGESTDTTTPAVTAKTGK